MTRLRIWWSNYWGSHDEVKGWLWAARECAVGLIVFVFMLWITNNLEPGVRWALTWL